MIEEKPELLGQIFERYHRIDGMKIIESLKKFKFKDDEEMFAKACLAGVIEYFEGKSGEMTDEEFLALLVRLVMMYFVEVKHHSDLWYLILSALLPKEIQMAKMSVVVRMFEEQFIELMEMIEKVKGSEGVRDAVLVFLFKENADFTLPVLHTIAGKIEQISKLLH